MVGNALEVPEFYIQLVLLFAELRMCQFLNLGSATIAM